MWSRDDQDRIDQGMSDLLDRVNEGDEPSIDRLRRLVQAVGREAPIKDLHRVGHLLWCMSVERHRTERDAENN